MPTLIASFWGMNVPVPFERSSLGFGIMLGLSLVFRRCDYIHTMAKKDVIDSIIAGAKILIVQGFKSIFGLYQRGMILMALLKFICNNCGNIFGRADKRG